MNPLSLFGCSELTAMLVCYALERRSRWSSLVFAVSWCALGLAYGFLQGALAIRIGRDDLVHCSDATMVGCCGAISLNDYR